MPVTFSLSVGQGRDLLADQAAGGGQALAGRASVESVSVSWSVAAISRMLPDLLDELRVVHRVQRVLIRQLRDHELQELVDIEVLQVVGAVLTAGGCCRGAISSGLMRLMAIPFALIG